MDIRHIAVIGAGIGGLAAAGLLQRAGHRVTVFERCDSPRAVGSALVIQPVGLALPDAYALAMALQGRWENASAACERMRRWHVRPYQAISRAFMPMYQSHSRVLLAPRNQVLALVAEWPVIRGVLTRLVSGDMILPLAGVRLRCGWRARG